MSVPRKIPDEGSRFVSAPGLLSLGLAALVAEMAGIRGFTTLAAAFVLPLAALRLLSRFALDRLSAELPLDAVCCFPGERFELRGHVDNAKFLPVAALLDFGFGEGLDRESIVGFDGNCVIGPHNRLEGRVVFRALRRGLHRIGPLRIVAGDVFGLHRRERLIPFARDIVVFPRRIETREPGLPLKEFFGIHPVRGIVDDPAWYEGTRDYRGDKSARYIHWKASARLASLQEKVSAPTSHRKVILAFHGEGFAQASEVGLFETALEVAASLATSLAETGASIAIATDRSVSGLPAALPLGRGPEHLGLVLELLARCERAKGQALGPDYGDGSTLRVVIARRWDASTARYLSLAPRRLDRVLFLFAEKAPGEAEASTVDEAEEARIASLASRRGCRVLLFANLVAPARGSGEEEIIV